MFYLGGRGPRLNRYVGLSLVLHTALVLVFWSVAKTHLRAVRPAAIDVHIRTVPAFPSRPAMPPKPRPGLAQATAPTLPAAAPRRKIGRIIEKKFKLDMPEIQPQTALRRSGRDDEVRLRDKNVAKFVRSEQVELIDIERKQAYEPPAPAQTTAVQTPPGEYVPAAALAKVEVNIDYVEIPFDAPDKIDLDQVQWTPAVAARPTVAPPAASSGDARPAGETARRRILKLVKPEPPPNLDIQEPRVDVILKVLIAENGFISQAEIDRSSGYLELDNRALAAIRQCIYESAAKKEARLVRIEYVF